MRGSQKVGYMAEEETESRLDLARRYRPKTLDGYIGNERLVETLR